MPICSVCASSDILCAKCSRMLEEGAVSEAEVRVTRAVHALGKASGMNIAFSRVVDAGSAVAIIADAANAGKLIGMGGRNVRRLAEALGRDVRVIEDAPEKRIIENVLRVPVAGVNKVYGAGEAYRVRIKRTDRERAERALRLLEKVLGKKVFLANE